MLNSEPLMFIDTANTLIKDHNQKVFDSRYYIKKEKQEEPKKEINPIIKDKLERIISLSQKDKLVWCKILLEETIYEGIPVELKEEELFLKQESTNIVIDIKYIIDVLILTILGS